MRRITRIKTRNLSGQRRLPRLGKVRLGVKKRSKNGNEYPSETPHFVVPVEVAKVYGETPMELDVMIPVEDEGISFPQAFEFYGTGRGLKCTGDGETAYRRNEETNSIDTVECPSPEECEYCMGKSGPQCNQRGHLAVILYNVNMGGIYEITTSSYNSIVDINSGIDYIRAMIGRVAMVPLTLRRVETETHHDGSKQTHYTLKLELPEGSSAESLNLLMQDTSRILTAPQIKLPAPDMTSPAYDGGMVVDEDTGEVLEGEVEPDEEQAQPTELQQTKLEQPPKVPSRETTVEEGESLKAMKVQILRANSLEEVNQAVNDARGQATYREACTLAKERIEFLRKTGKIK